MSASPTPTSPPHPAPAPVEDDLLNMFSFPTPPRAPRRSRSRSPSSPTTPIPSKRPRQEALFASPSASPQAPPPRAPAVTARGGKKRDPPRLANRYLGAERQREVMALFDDLGDGDFGPPDGSGDAGAGFDPLAMGGSVGATATGAVGEGGKEKVKRVIPKLDPERLLGENGLPALVDLAKRFKIKGKSHELQDLSALLQTYQLWAHHMFPKLNFRDAVGRVEGVCHKREVQIAWKRVKEEEKSRKLRLLRGSPTPEPIPSDAEADGDAQPENQGQSSPHRSPEPHQSQRQSGSAQEEEEEEEEEDLEALIAQAEMEAEEFQAAAQGSGSGQGAGGQGRVESGAGLGEGGEEEGEEDYEAMMRMEEMGDEMGAPEQGQGGKKVVQQDDEEEEGWAAMMED